MYASTKAYVKASMTSAKAATTFMKTSMKDSVDVTSVKTSITSVKASITSKKASVKAFVEASSMESFVEDFIEAHVEVTSMEVFISSISSKEASTGFHAK